MIGYMIDKEADPILQDHEGRDSLDYCPFDAEYVKGIIRAKSGKGVYMKIIVYSVVVRHMNYMTPRWIDMIDITRYPSLGNYEAV